MQLMKTILVTAFVFMMSSGLMAGLRQKQGGVFYFTAFVGVVMVAGVGYAIYKKKRGDVECDTEEE